MYTPLVVGSLLAVCVSAYAWMAGLDRSRAFYPTALIVVASYYVLFAVMGGSRGALIADVLVMAGFVVLATLGHARSLWLVAAGLAGHGIMDAFHGGIIVNAGVPVWWPAFCGSYDVVAAGALAFILARRQGEDRKVRAIE